AAAVPGAGFLDQFQLYAEINDFRGTVGALAVQNHELGLFERRRDFVLDHLDPGFTADDLVTVFYRADAANIQPYRGIEFQCIAAGGGFRVAEHDADFHADLVDENHQGIGALDVTGDLAQ